jgi:Maltose acetyltransferase
MRARMLRGELYLLSDDADREAEFSGTQELLVRFNGARPNAWEERDGLLRRALRQIGEGVVRAPFY